MKQGLRRKRREKLEEPVTIIWMERRPPLHSLTWPWAWPLPALTPACPPSEEKREEKDTGLQTQKGRKEPERKGEVKTHFICHKAWWLNAIWDGRVTILTPLARLSQREWCSERNRKKREREGDRREDEGCKVGLLWGDDITNRQEKQESSQRDLTKHMGLRRKMTEPTSFLLYEGIWEYVPVLLLTPPLKASTALHCFILFILSRFYFTQNHFPSSLTG